MPIGEVIKSGIKLASKDKLEKFNNTDFTDDIRNCSNAIGLELNVIRSVIERIKG